MFQYEPIPDLSKYGESSRPFHRHYKHLFFLKRGSEYAPYYEAQRWCNQQYGEGRMVGGLNWAGGNLFYGTVFHERWAYHTNGVTIYLHEDNDAFEFRLRWC